MCYDEILKVLRTALGGAPSDLPPVKPDLDAPNGAEDNTMDEIIYGWDSRYWDGILPPEYENHFSVYFQKVAQGVGWVPSEGWNQLQLNWKRVKEVYRIPRGPYCYTIMPYHDQNMIQRGEIAADDYLRVINESFQGDQGELPPVVDLENVHPNMALEEDLALFVRAKLERASEIFNKRPMVYTATWFWDQYIAPYVGDWKYYEEYELWEADPPPDTPIAGWVNGGAVVQVALSKTIPGFNTVVDLNETTREWLNKQIGVTPPPLPTYKDGYNQAIEDAVTVIEALTIG
jgi:hypothetical protein